MCLCPICAKPFYDSKEHFIQRADKNQNLKDTCMFCNSRQIVANPIIKEGSRIEENISIERDPKTSNSFRVLRVPEVIITELEKRKCQIDMYKEKMQEAFIDNAFIPEGREGAG